MAEITDEMVTAFRRAATDRLMHEDGCPEGEQIRAGLEAVAPLIRNIERERCAKLAKIAWLKAPYGEIADADANAIRQKQWIKAENGRLNREA
jgi:hypothetical protein